MSAGKKVGGLLGLVFALAFVSVMFTILVAIAIWPGEAKLTAPFLCPDDRPDAFVVRDTTNPQPGETVINFSLHCVGENGEVTDVGYFRPFALLVLFHAAIFLPLMLLSGIRRRRTRAEIDSEIRAITADPDSTTSARDDDPPFVDSSTKGPFVN